MTAILTNPLRVGLRQERVISPQCIVIFGASGDLTHRKLVPALFELFRQRRLPSEFAVLGCARRPWSDEEFRSRMAASLAVKSKTIPRPGSSSPRACSTSRWTCRFPNIWSAWVSDWK
jgi:glucose-6-phosphate 1-dehydrogenase